MKQLKTTCIAVFAFLLSAGIARSDLEVSWFTVDGGGHMSSTGGAFELAGTIGQPEASSFNQPIAGGAFTLVGGFWPAATFVCGCAGDLTGDSLINGADVQKFVDCFLGAGASCPCADVDGAAGLSTSDVTVFAANLLSGAACP